MLGMQECRGQSDNQLAERIAIECDQVYGRPPSKLSGHPDHGGVPIQHSKCAAISSRFHKEISMHDGIGNIETLKQRCASFREPASLPFLACWVLRVVENCSDGAGTDTWIYNTWSGTHSDASKLSIGKVHCARIARICQWKLAELHIKDMGCADANTR